MGETMRHMLTYADETFGYFKTARLVFEKEMVRMASAARQPAQIASLREIIAAMDAVKAEREEWRPHRDGPDATEFEPDAFIRLDGEFHKAIAAMSGNPVLAALCGALFDWLAYFHLSRLRSPAWSGSSSRNTAASSTRSRPATPTSPWAGWPSTSTGRVRCTSRSTSLGPGHPTRRTSGLPVPGSGCPDWRVGCMEQGEQTAVVAIRGLPPGTGHEFIPERAQSRAIPPLRAGRDQVDDAMTLLMTLLIGIVAGSRAMTAPAAVAWGAWLGWLTCRRPGPRSSARAGRSWSSPCSLSSNSSPTSCRRRRAARCRRSSARASSPAPSPGRRSALAGGARSAA